MPSHTIAERLKKTTRGLKRNVVAPGTTSNQNIQTRIGQAQDQTNLITPKKLEQPLVRVGGVRIPLKGRSVLRDIRDDISPDITRKFKESPGFFETEDVGLSTPELLRRQKRRAGKAKGGIRPATIDVAKEAIVPAITNAQPSAVDKGGIRAKPGGLGRFAGLISLRKTLTTRKATGIKGRRAEIKSINESINVLVKQLDATALTGSEDQNTKITEQIEALSTERSNLFAGGGSRGGGANFDTPEGFAAFLASKNIPPEERLSLTRRLFANGP